MSFNNPECQEEADFYDSCAAEEEARIEAEIQYDHDREEERLISEIRLIAKLEDTFKELGKEIYSKWKQGTLSIYLEDLLKNYDKKIKEIELNTKEVTKKDGDAEKRRSEDFNRESID